MRLTVSVDLSCTERLRSDGLLTAVCYFLMKKEAV